ncbi:unnamed protein product [Orchesella dallaii]|uniref:DOMON domain-containing protein n=1 Tax=Orchesella dallaii TaxID=48710 RepID=A0ABP1RPK4_9HEXA
MYFVRLAICVVLCATLAASRLMILEEGRYHVDLEIRGVGEEATISLAINAYTTGYVGFGFGLTNELPGTDVFMGGVISIDSIKQPYIDDYYIGEEKIRVKDECVGCQNWNLVSADESNGRTTLVVERLLTTNDTQWDIAITNTNLYVRWSTGETDSVEGVASWKGRLVNLFNVDDTPTSTTPRSTTTTSTVSTTTEGPATRHINLDDNYTVELSLTGNGVNGVIELLLKVNTAGYVGFGLSRSPNMTGADLFIGGYNAVDKTLYGKDYHGDTNEMPVEDLSGQDWMVLGGYEWEGMTTLQIMRILDTSSPQEDIAIQNSDLYVIWSYGENDTISQHNARGSRLLNLFVVDDGQNSGSGSDFSPLRTNFLLLLMVAFAFLKS